MNTVKRGGNRVSNSGPLVKSVLIFIGLSASYASTAQAPQILTRPVQARATTSSVYD
jgi:hypothetical protein